MQKISRSYGQGSVLERRHINSMLRNVEEYELTKSGNHKKYQTLENFYVSKNICRQNFLKYYRRYINSNKDINSLLPQKIGRKFKKELDLNPDIIDKIQSIRKEGYNKFEIIAKLKKIDDNIDIAPTSMYRILRRLGLNQLNPIIKEEKRRIVKMSTGELGHIDIHYIAANTVIDNPKKKLYLLGLIDSYSRICWIEVVDSIKAIDVSFAAMDIMAKLKHRYNIEFKEIMSDNGSEFASRKNPSHPFEKMLGFYNIAHRYTKPCSPKTNGKIERFWKTIEEELLSGEQFKTIEELKHHILGYNIYYNEHRMHQGINNKMPVNMV